VVSRACFCFFFGRREEKRRIVRSFVRETNSFFSPLSHFFAGPPSKSTPEIESSLESTTSFGSMGNSRGSESFSTLLSFLPFLVASSSLIPPPSPFFSIAQIRHHRQTRPTSLYYSRTSDRGRTEGSAFVSVLRVERNQNLERVSVLRLTLSPSARVTQTGTSVSSQGNGSRL